MAKRGPAANDPIADISDVSDAGQVISFYSSTSPRWTRPLNLDGLFRHGELGEEVRKLRDLPLRWRWASSGDWPRQRLIASDFRHARKGGYGFIVEIADQRLFLVPRGWDEPEWGLASYNLKLKTWRDLGDLEPAPEHWIFPTVEERSPGP